MGLYSIHRLCNLYTPNSATALVHAVKNDDLDIVRDLITIGKVDLNLAQFNGDSALHVAIERQNRFIVQLLVDAEANVFAKNRDDQTCLEVAQAKPSRKIEAILRKSLDIMKTYERFI